MVTYADPKSKTETGAKSDQRPEIHVTQSNKGSGSTIAYIVAAIVLIAGAYLLFANNTSTTTVVPSVMQNNTTLPAPDLVAPAPATPPAMEPTTPPAPVPATPPATEPVAP